MILGRAGEGEKPGENRELLVVEFENIGEFEGGLEDFQREEIFAEIDVENAQGIAAGGSDERADGGAGNFVALGEGAEAKGVGAGDDGAGEGGGGDIIPGDVFADGEARLAVGIQLDTGGAGGGGGIDGDALGEKLHVVKARQHFAAEEVVADAGNEAGFGAEGLGVVGEVGGGAAELLAPGEDVPERLTEADHGHFAIRWHRISHGCGDGRTAQ